MSSGEDIVIMTKDEYPRFLSLKCLTLSREYVQPLATAWMDVNKARLFTPPVPWGRKQSPTVIKRAYVINLFPRRDNQGSKQCLKKSLSRNASRMDPAARNI